ncbi:MAG TPA: autotransporter-associated beta strand repeat-containing protein, partial [Chthoniobacterales bacterium]|nr:autotransporter-associated beta strand repeat-containing protein [Chthoniobacterales bacterium]
LSSGGGGMTWALGNATSNVIQVNGAGQITLANVSGASRQLEKIGPGTLLLSGFNTWTGGTVLNGGTIRLNPNVILGSTSAPLTINAGTFDMASEDQTVGALNGSGGMIVANAAGSQAKVITVGNGGANGSYGGVIADRTSGNQLVSLVKIGTGTQILSGSNTYTAGTAVNAGTLLVYNTTGSGTGTQLVFLPGNAGATFGGGTVDGTGGISGTLRTSAGNPANNLSPSSATGETGILRVGTLDARDVFIVDIGGTVPGVSYDQISATTSAAFFGSLRVRFIDGFETNIQPTDVFDILVSGSGTISHAISNLNGNGRLPVSGLPGTFAVQLINGNKTLRLTDFQLVPVTFASWAAENYLSGPNALPTADADGDGLSNFEEYAFAHNPNVSDNTGLTQPTTVQVGGESYLALTFVRAAGLYAPTDVTYIYERSTTELDNWTSAGLVVTSTPGSGNTETVTVRSASPIVTLAKEFLRVRVTSP